jgi:hypothetical protein
MTQYRSYVLVLSGGNESEQAALAPYNKRLFESLGEARRVSGAICILFPEVKCRIASIGVPVKPQPIILNG